MVQVGASATTGCGCARLAAIGPQGDPAAVTSALTASGRSAGAPGLDQVGPLYGRSAVGVGAVLDGDDFDLDAGLDDLVDDPVVTSAGTVFALELEA